MKSIKSQIAAILALLLCLSSVAGISVFAGNTFNPDYLHAESVVAIDDGGAVIDAGGKLWMWGDDIGETPQYICDNVAMISFNSEKFSSSGMAVLKKDGTLWMKGKNEYGTVGNGTLEPVEDFVKVLDNVIYVDLTEEMSSAVCADGSLWLWGISRGQIGTYDTTSPSGVYKIQSRPAKVMDDVLVAKVAKWQVAVLKKDRTLWKVEKASSSVFTEYVPVFDNVKDFYLPYDHNCVVIGQDDRAWINNVQWSSKEEHFYYTDEAGKKTELWVKPMDNIKIYNGNTIIKTDNSLWVKGGNSCGQVGNGTRTEVSDYVKVLDNVASVSSGSFYRLAVTTDGGVWGWGDNTEKQLGNGGVYNDYQVFEKPYIPPGQLAFYKEGTEYYQTVPYRMQNITAAAPWKVAPKCKVTLDLDGGTGDAYVLCTQGELLTPPNNPEKIGFYFAGWYKDKAKKILWNFDTDIVDEDCTLYAKWALKTTETVIAEPSHQDVLIDGEQVIFNTYILRDEQGFDVNFVKLRDVAYLLNHTPANFNVDWRNNAIRLDPKVPYTTQNGAELTVPTVIAAPTKTSLTPVLTKGVTAPLEAFLLEDENGGGHNYFKLRDIGKVAGFQVEWDNRRGCIVITTNKPYSE